MFLEHWLKMLRHIEDEFESEVERFLRGHPGHHYRRSLERKTTLAFTEITFSNHQKIKGVIMDFILSKDTPSVTLLLQALKGGAILPGIDTITGHKTIKDGTLVIAGDANIVVTQDPTNLLLVTVSRANNTTNATSALTANAKNDEDQPISGSSVVTVVADPVIDTGIADSLQFVPAPVVAPAAQA